MKPRLFVGSSVESLPLAYAIQNNLRHSAEVTVWDQGIFRPSGLSLQSLVEGLQTFDFGVFVFAPDDLVTIREEESRAVRDNVVFELGLFIGQLGQDRCFFFLPDNGNDLHLPTDLLGVTPCVYETDRSDGNWQAATGPACNEIRQEVGRLGQRRALGEESEGSVPSMKEHVEPLTTTGAMESKRTQSHPVTPEVEAATEIEPWLDALISREYERALQLINQAEREDPEDARKVDLQGWKAFTYFQLSMQEGERAFMEFAEANPSSARPWRDLVSCLYHAGFFERALTRVDEALEKFPDSSALIQERAQILFALDRRREAITYLEQQMTRIVEAEELIGQLAAFLMSDGDTEQAEEVLARGLGQNPFSIVLLEMQANLYMSTRAPAEAVRVYMKLISLRPKEPSYSALMGNALLDLDLYGMALASYENADELAGHQQAWIVANIGNVLNNRGFFDAAIQRLEAALHLEPKSEYAQERLLFARRNRDAEKQKLEILLRNSAAKRLTESRGGPQAPVAGESTKPEKAATDEEMD